MELCILGLVQRVNIALLISEIMLMYRPTSYKMFAPSMKSVNKRVAQDILKNLMMLVRKIHAIEGREIKYMSRHMYEI